MSLADLEKEFGTDKKLEEEGVWVYPSLRNPKLGFLIRRMSQSNREWANYASASYRKNRRKIEGGNISDPKILEDAYRVFCSTILIRWNEELVDKEGNPITYSVQKGIALFKKFPDLYARLSDDAQEISTFQQEDIEEVAGKSESISSGS